MLRQVVDYLEGILDVPLDAKRQSLKSLQEDERTDRRERGACVTEQYRPCAGDVGSRANRLGEYDSVVAVVRLGELGEFAGGFPVELARIHDDSADGGTVSAYELGSGMHDDICTVLDGPEQVRRSESVIDDEGNLVCVGDSGHRFDIDQVRVGVSEALNEDRLCLRFDRLFEVGQVGRIHESSRDTVGDQCVLEKVVGASIDILGGNDMVSRTGDIEDGIGDGGGAGGHGQSADASLQGSDALLEDILGGVGQTAVYIARISQTETRGRVLGVVEYV